MKRKCPHCGSSDTASILWGLPVFSEELEKAVADREIVLGGCCISENNPSFHCNACGKNFGKQPFVRTRKKATENESRELYTNIITGIVFSEGGYFDGKNLIEITVKDGKRIYTYTNSHYYKNACVGEISDAQWKKLMNTLFRRLYIHEWKKRYVNPYILDGTEWNLELKLTKGRRLNIYGSNKFPPLYKDLVRAFKPFMKNAEKE